jgi:hypothetical protein
MRRPLALLVAPVFVGCAGAGGPPAPPTLSYEVPTEPSAVYVQGDTALVEVDAGGQTIEVEVGSTSTLDMTFEAAAGGEMRVVALFRDLQARATNPMGPPQEVNQDAIDGELIFTLTSLGEGTIVSVPEIDAEIQTFLSPSLTALTFFPRLPGRAVTAGDTWTDTINIDTEEGETSIEATSVVTYTAVGDTTVMGRSLLHVSMTSEDDRYVEGTQMGMDMSQEVVGTSEGWFLWDPVRRLPAEIVVHSVGDGTMEVSAAPFPLALKADNTTRITLQGMGGGM